MLTGKHNLPLGFPALELGDNTSQNIQWFKWPPPLNLSTGPSSIIVLVSPAK